MTTRSTRYSIYAINPNHRVGFGDAFAAAIVAKLNIHHDGMRWTGTWMGLPNDRVVPNDLEMYESGPSRGTWTTHHVIDRDSHIESLALMGMPTPGSKTGAVRLARILMDLPGMEGIALGVEAADVTEWYGGHRVHRRWDVPAERSQHPPA
jgi:hypothetical protein